MRAPLTGLNRGESERAGTTALAHEHKSPLRLQLLNSCQSLVLHELTSSGHLLRLLHPGARLADSNTLS